MFSYFWLIMGLTKHCYRASKIDGSKIYYKILFFEQTAGSDYYIYHKVASSRLSRLVANSRIFRLLVVRENLMHHREFLEHWNSQKVFLTFDNIFHVYLMRGFQTYERNLILMMAFWVTCKVKSVQLKTIQIWIQFFV